MLVVRPEEIETGERGFTNLTRRFAAMTRNGRKQASTIFTLSTDQGGA